MPLALAKVVQVVPRVRGAKDPDDRFILHAAALLGCQFVSNDNYSDWHEKFLREGEGEMAAWLSRNEWNLRVAFVFLAAPTGTLFLPNKHPPQATAATPSATPSPPAAPSPTAAGGLTLTYRIMPPLNASLRTVYADDPRSQTLPDLRSLIAEREGQPASWAARLVLYDRHGHPLRDAHDCDDDETLKPGAYHAPRAAAAAPAACARACVRPSCVRACVACACVRACVRGAEGACTSLVRACVRWHPPLHGP